MSLETASRTRVLMLFFNATDNEIADLIRHDPQGYLMISDEVITQHPELKNTPIQRLMARGQGWGSLGGNTCLTLSLLLQVTIEDIVSSYPRPFRLNS